MNTVIGLLVLAAVVWYLISRSRKKAGKKPEPRDWTRPAQRSVQVPENMDWLKKGEGSPLKPQTPWTEAARPPEPTATATVKQAPARPAWERNETSTSAQTAQPAKVRRLGTLPNSYIVVDIETTGLDAARDSIIELAAVRVEDGEITEQYESLINPGYPIDDFIAMLTGITNDMLESAPSLEEKLVEYLDFIRRDTMLGHYLNFDLRFIGAGAARMALEFDGSRYIDTLGIARVVYPEWKHHRLCDLVGNLNIPCDQAHRALADVMSTKRCYDSLRATLIENGLIDPSGKPVKQKQGAAAMTIQEDAYMPDIDIMDKMFVFTGDLTGMTRTEAMQRVLNAGGQCGDRVTKNTDYLVIGNAGYEMTLKYGKSTKQLRAEELKLEGGDIEIISEDVFLQMLEPNE